MGLGLLVLRFVPIHGVNIELKYEEEAGRIKTGFHHGHIKVARASSSCTDMRRKVSLGRDGLCSLRAASLGFA